MGAGSFRLIYSRLLRMEAADVNITASDIVAAAALLLAGFGTLRQWRKERARENVDMLTVQQSVDAKLWARVQAEFDKYDACISEYDARISELEIIVKERDRRISTLERENTALESRVAELEADNRRLRGKR